MSEGVSTPSGHATFEIVRKNAWVPDDLDARLRAYRPHTQLGEIVRACLYHLPERLGLELLDQMGIVLVGESALSIEIVRADGSREDWGTVSRKVITNTGVNAAIAAMG